MKRLLWFGTLLGALAVAGPAHAGGYFSLNIGLPLVSVHIGSAPRHVYVPPPPVYVAPRAFIAPPVHVAPRVVVVRPAPVYIPRRVVRAAPIAVCRHHHRHHHCH